MKEKVTLEQMQYHGIQNMYQIPDFEDKVYELAQALVRSAIDKTEEQYELKDDDRLDSSQEWYDDVRERMMELAYQRIYDFLGDND